MARKLHGRLGGPNLLKLEKDLFSQNPAPRYVQGSGMVEGL
jgi:hypothetical protein